MKSIVAGPPKGFEKMPLKLLFLKHQDLPPLKAQPLSEDGFAYGLKTETCQFLGLHLVGIWIGGVWNGHFQSPKNKYSSEAEISRKMPEIPQKERFSPNFRLRKLKIQSPKKCNSIPPAVPYPH